MVSVLRVSVSD